MEDNLFHRRQVLTGGIIAALGTLWKPGEALAADTPPEAQGATVVYDVACLGNSFARDMQAALDAAGGDMRGASFFVEGNLYPEGAIPAGDGFDPESVPAVGHWLCRGWFMFYPGRPLPHVITTQEYVLGRISAEQLVPADQLVSSGVEGGVPLAIRSVIGGTGRHRGARGEVVQQTIGTNKTQLNVTNSPAPNFRFYFKL